MNGSREPNLTDPPMSENEAVSIPEPDDIGDEDHQTPYRDILRGEMRTALREFDRPTSGLFMSSLSAGLDIGFGPFLMAVFSTLAGDSLTQPVLELILAGLYSVGFLFVILGRSELFTEHTTMAVLPVLSRQADIGDLARVWGVILLGNLLGAVAFSALASFVGRQLGIVDSEALTAIADTLTGHPWWVVLLSAILAGWIMGLLTWLVGAARDTISQLVLIVIVAGSIGLASLHHSIAGSVEMLFGVFSGSTTAGAFFAFLVWAILGNAFGGTVFVALLKYSHVVRSQPDSEAEPARD